MSDPFDRLRASSDVSVAPDMGAIRGRARRIEQRRRLVVGGSAASVAVVALIAVVLSIGDAGRVNDVAQSSRDSLTSPTSGEVESMSDSATEGRASGVKGGKAKAPSSAGTDTGAAASGQTAAGSAGAPSNVTVAPAEPLAAKVTVAPRPLGGADFTLEVCNTSKEVVERSFGDSQRYDFEVSEGRQVVWRWSEGRSFAQVVGEEKWKAEECKEWIGGWDGEGTAPQTYKVVGLLASDPQVRSKAVEFCSGLC